MIATQNVRPIQIPDNPFIAAIIRQVLTEYGANREGFAFADAELDELTQAFAGSQSAYWIATMDNKVVGGAGFGPLQGGDPSICELKKMYLLPEARGCGFGKGLMDVILKNAKEAGYRRIYLETTANMTQARALYEKYGFQRLAGPLGATGHFGCEIQYMRSL
jgi:putative acetyltransferase